MAAQMRASGHSSCWYIELYNVGTVYNFVHVPYSIHRTGLFSIYSCLFSKKYTLKSEKQAAGQVTGMVQIFRNKNGSPRTLKTD